MLEVRRSTRVFASAAIRIDRYGSARELTRGAAYTGAALLVLGAAMTLSVLAFETAGMVLAIPLGMIALVLFVVCLFCAGVAPWLWLRALLARGRPGTIEVGETLVVQQLSDRMVEPVLAMVGAHLDAPGDVLVLHTASGDRIRVAVTSQAEAEALLEAIARAGVRGTWLATLCSPGEPRQWIRAAWPLSLGVLLLVSLVTSLIVSGEIGVSLGIVIGGGILGAAAVLRRPDTIGTVVIGRDGLAIRSDEGLRERFVAFDTIESARAEARGVTLVLRGGETIHLGLQPPSMRAPAGSLPMTVLLAEKRQAYLLERIEESLSHGAPEPPRAGSLLERRGRSVPAWREGLRALLNEAGDYRKAMLSREQAAQVLEDRHATGELRIGAALALTLAPPTERTRVEGQRVRRVDHHTAERLRVAVETCVDQDVRIALRQAIYAELDEDTLARALRSDAARR